MKRTLPDAVPYSCAWVGTFRVGELVRFNPYHTVIVTPDNKKLLTVIINAIERNR